MESKNPKFKDDPLVKVQNFEETHIQTFFKVTRFRVSSLEMTGFKIYYVYQLWPENNFAPPHSNFVPETNFKLGNFSNLKRAKQKLLSYFVDLDQKV